MLLILLLCHHLFATGLQGQLLPASIDEGSSRPVDLPSLLGRSGELGRLLIQTPLTRASSFLNYLFRTVWETNKASMSQLRRPPLTRLRERGREVEGSWPWSSYRRVKTRQQTFLECKREWDRRIPPIQIKNQTDQKVSFGVLASTNI